MKVQKSEVIAAINELARERGLSKEMLYTTIEDAIRAAYKKNLPKGTPEPNNVVATLDREDGSIHVYARMLVAEPLQPDFPGGGPGHPPRRRDR